MVEHPAVYTLLSIFFFTDILRFVKEVPRTLCATVDHGTELQAWEMRQRETRPAFTSDSRISLAEASRDAWDTRVSFFSG